MTATAKHEEMMRAEVKPPKSLEEVNLFEPGAQEHWFDAYKFLHAEAPVHPIPGEGALPGTDAFILSKYDDIAAVVRDPEHFPAYNAWMTVDQAAELVEREGFEALTNRGDSLRPNLEMHKKQRLELTGPWVGPEGAKRNTEMVTEAANDLIDQWIDRGEVEFVSEFAAPLPQRVITTIIGFPLEDMEITRHWADAQVERFVFGSTHKNLLTAEEEAANAAELAKFHEYTMKQVARKRREPGNDLMSFLTQVEFAGRKLTDEQIAGVAFQMHIGGHDTTRYVLAAEGMLLAQHPELVEELRADRGKIRFFVEEALRLFAPTQGLSTRLVAEDTEIRGVKIPRGSILHLRYGAANRDPDLAENPGAGRPHAQEPGSPPHLLDGAACLPRRRALASGAEHRRRHPSRSRRRPAPRSRQERLPPPARHHARHERAASGVQAPGIAAGRTEAAGRHANLHRSHHPGRLRRLARAARPRHARAWRGRRCRLGDALPRPRRPACGRHRPAGGVVRALPGVPRYAVHAGDDGERTDRGPAPCSGSWTRSRCSTSQTSDGWSAI